MKIDVKENNIKKLKKLILENRKISLEFKLKLIGYLEIIISKNYDERNVYREMKKGGFYERTIKAFKIINKYLYSENIEEIQLLEKAYNIYKVLIEIWESKHEVLNDLRVGIQIVKKIEGFNYDLNKFKRYICSLTSNKEIKQYEYIKKIVFG